MSRPFASTVRLLPLIGLCAVLVGCGAPPQPLPTAPPRAAGTGSVAPSGSAYPPGVLPPGTVAPGGLPAGLPTAGVATYPVPGYPGGLPTYPGPPTTAVPTTTPARTTPPPAPRCTAGPTRPQVLAVVKDKPGIPSGRDLAVTEGPYCAGSWQFAVVRIVGESADESDPLLVVTTGRPAALTLVAAGADVCTDRVESDAPAGIRVRACGF